MRSLYNLSATSWYSLPGDTVEATEDGYLDKPVIVVSRADTERPMLVSVRVRVIASKLIVVVP
jgi:hypothetical protein